MGTMKKIGMRIAPVVLLSVLACGLGSQAPATLMAQEAYRLMSAQVVTRTEGPASLRITANGPIAFRVLTASEAGEPAAPNKTKARLYGVAPGDLTGSGLTPFVLVAQADGQDTLLTVTASSNVKLELRAGKKSNELEVVASALQP
jgi:hypothetical protein